MARSMTIDDLYQLKFLSRPRISPDGERIAYVVTTIDELKHVYRSRIWMTTRNGRDAVSFTLSTANSHSPAWSPDGRWLAFVSDREADLAGQDPAQHKLLGKGKPQIWLMPTNGGEARQLTYMQHGASAPVWSPDGQSLLFGAQVGPADEETATGEPLPKVRVIDRLWYKLDGVGFIHERRTHLFLISISGGAVQQVTDGDWDDGDPAWSPDGQQVAFVSNHREDRWRQPGDDLYVLTLSSNQVADPRCLTSGTLACAAPAWSPDGQTLAFLAAAKVHSAEQVSLYTIAASATETEPRNISQAFPGSCGDSTNSDLGDEHLMPAPAWSADGETLYVLSSYRGAARIYAIPSTGADAEPATLTPGDLHVRDLSIDATRQTLALLVGDTTHPAEIYLRSTAAEGELQRVTTANDALCQELTLSTPELIQYAGADGWPMEGWIMKPRDFDPAKKYPLLIEIHGGPATQYGYGFFHEMQVLVAQGYVLFFCNPRGSLGYGYAFSAAVRGQWGEKDSLDIMLGMDEVIKQGYIDEQRLAVTGGSYGGFMTNWLVGHYQRFKVAITDRCVSNVATMFGTSDIGWILGYDNLDTTPWDDLDKYMHMSPMKYVKNIHTPLLIIHSEQDLRCNIEQSEQLFAALQWLGREVKFVRFEGQSHGLSRGGHPHSRKARLQHMLDWFARYL